MKSGYLLNNTGAMPITRIEDGTGETIVALEVDGYHTDSLYEVIENQEDVFRSIPDWKIKPDDVFICDYPKAGTHWLWEITTMLINQSLDIVKYKMDMTEVEAVTKDMFDNLASPRVLYTHLPLRLLPKELLKQRARIIFMQRNPKDMCVSSYNLYKKFCSYEYDGKWENFVERYMKGLVLYGSWFDYTLEWEKVINENPDYPFHLISYEDLKTDNVKEITKLSEFLGLKSDSKLIEKIADKCEFSNMKKEKDLLEDPSDWKHGQPGVYRKGQIGDWKNWFTVAQSERFDAVFTDRMKNSSFTYRYE